MLGDTGLMSCAPSTSWEPVGTCCGFWGSPGCPERPGVMGGAGLGPHSGREEGAGGRGWGSRAGVGGLRRPGRGSSCCLQTRGPRPLWLQGWQGGLARQTAEMPAWGPVSLGSLRRAGAPHSHFLVGSQWPSWFVASALQPPTGPAPLSDSWPLLQAERAASCPSGRRLCVGGWGRAVGPVPGGHGSLGLPHSKPACDSRSPPLGEMEGDCPSPGSLPVASTPPARSQPACQGHRQSHGRRLLPRSAPQEQRSANWTLHPDSQLAEPRLGWGPPYPALPSLPAASPPNE